MPPSTPPSSSPWSLPILALVCIIALPPTTATMLPPQHMLNASWILPPKPVIFHDDERMSIDARVVKPDLYSLAYTDCVANKDDNRLLDCDVTYTTYERKNGSSSIVHETTRHCLQTLPRHTSLLLTEGGKIVASLRTDGEPTDSPVERVVLLEVEDCAKPGLSAASAAKPRADKPSSEDLGYYVAAEPQHVVVYSSTYDVIYEYSPSVCGDNLRCVQTYEAKYGGKVGGPRGFARGAKGLTRQAVYLAKDVNKPEKGYFAVDTTERNLDVYAIERGGNVSYSSSHYIGMPAHLQGYWRDGARLTVDLYANVERNVHRFLQLDENMQIVADTYKVNLRDAEVHTVHNLRDASRKFLVFQRTLPGLDLEGRRYKTMRVTQVLPNGQEHYNLEWNDYDLPNDRHKWYTKEFFMGVHEGDGKGDEFFYFPYVCVAREMSSGKVEMWFKVTRMSKLNIY